jgi:hypothetical protein
LSIFSYFAVAIVFYLHLIKTKREHAFFDVIYVFLEKNVLKFEILLLGETKIMKDSRIITEKILSLLIDREGFNEWWDEIYYEDQLDIKKEITETLEGEREHQNVSDQRFYTINKKIISF